MDGDERNRRFPSVTREESDLPLGIDGSDHDAPAPHNRRNSLGPNPICEAGHGHAPTPQHVLAGPPFPNGMHIISV